MRRVMILKSLRLHLYVFWFTCNWGQTTPAVRRHTRVTKFPQKVKRAHTLRPERALLCAVVLHAPRCGFMLYVHPTHDAIRLPPPPPPARSQVTTTAFPSRPLHNLMTTTVQRAHATHARTLTLNTVPSVLADTTLPTWVGFRSENAAVVATMRTYSPTRPGPEGVAGLPAPEAAPAAGGAAPAKRNHRLHTLWSCPQVPCCCLLQGRSPTAVLQKKSRTEGGDVPRAPTNKSEITRARKKAVMQTVHVATY